MKNTIIGVIVALLLGGVVGYVLHPSSIALPPQKAGAMTAGTGTPTGFDNIALTGGQRTGVNTATEYPIAPPSSTVVGNGLATLVTSGTFTNASNTVAVIPNPFLATSTVTFANVQGNNGTSTIALLVGTSTLSVGQSATNNSQVNPTLINTTLSTSTKYYVVGGINAGPLAGDQEAGLNTLSSIIVGPTQSIVILATSTNAAFAGALSGVTSPTTTFAGSYSFEWQR